MYVNSEVLVMLFIFVLLALKPVLTSHIRSTFFKVICEILFKPLIIEAARLLSYLYVRVTIHYPSPQTRPIFKAWNKCLGIIFMYSKMSRFPVSNIETIKKKYLPDERRK